MSFRLSDLVIESVLRDGLFLVRRDPTIIDDIFKKQLVEELGPLMAAKYGEKEVNRIRAFFTGKEVSIVGDFKQAMTNLPSISIQLVSDTEAKDKARIGDEEPDSFNDFEEPEEIQALVRASDIGITAYDPLTGTCSLDDGDDLSKVIVNMILEDIDGAEFLIVGGIVEVVGLQQIIIKDRTGTIIPAATDINITGPALIKSSIDFEQREIRGTTDDQSILIGVHTEERLLTIYLYTMVKYIISARKASLIERGFDLATYSGSDFTRDFEYVEPVFQRFLTMSGITCNDWESDKVVPIEEVIIEGFPEDSEDC